MTSRTLRHRARGPLGALLAAIVVLPLTGGAPAAADSYPRGRTLHPGALPRAADTTLLHTEGTVIVDGERRTRVRAPQTRLLGRDGRAYIVEAWNRESEHWRLLRVRRDGRTHVLARSPGYGPSAHLDEEAHQVLLRHTPRAGRTQVDAVGTRTGAVLSSRRFVADVWVLDAHNRRAVLSAWSGRRARTLTWRTATDQVARVSGRTSYVADIENNLIGLHIGNPEDDGCQRLARLDQPRRTVWRSCRDRVLSLSPRARRMVTTDVRSDGLGPRMIQVRNGRGRLLRTFRAEWFGFIAWENERQMLLQTAGKKNVAALRVTPRHAERASRTFRTWRRGGEATPAGDMDWWVPEH